MLHNQTAYPYAISVKPTAGTRFVTEAEARSFLRMQPTDITDDDLNAFIDAAQAATERFTRLTLFTTEFSTKRDHFTHAFVLRRAPLIDVVSITRLIKNVPTVVAATTFKTIDENVLNYGGIVLRDGQIWPTDQDLEVRTIEIKFRAGFGIDSTFLDPDLIQGMLRVLADMVENRGDCEAKFATLSNAGMALLDRFRIINV